MSRENPFEQPQGPSEVPLDVSVSASPARAIEEQKIAEESYEGVEKDTEETTEDVGKEEEGDQESKDEDPEAEEAEEAALESEIAKGQESMEGQIESIRASKERWLNNMNALEAAARGAGKRYEGLSGAEGMIASRKQQVEARLEGMEENLHGQKMSLLYEAESDPEKVIEEQRRIVEETRAEVELLARATAALDKGEEDMSADLNATLGAKLIQFENIIDGNELKDTGNASAIMKRLRRFLDAEDPMEGGAGAVSAAIGGYMEKIAKMRLPNEIAKRRLERKVEETEEKNEPEKEPEEKVEEVTFFGGEEKKENGDEGKDGAEDNVRQFPGQKKAA